ncbi:hypothetical protein GH140_04315, partial [bacterium]|nr:hypothetical protein [bacterium]
MGADGFRLKTQGDYNLDEVVSALQKSIRRGLEIEAMYWSMELLPRFERYLWRRLKIICSEDVGIANPQAIILVQVLSDQYFELRKRGDMGCLLMLSNAILTLCRSKKTRVADHAICHIIQVREQGILRLEIPDYALDIHTRRGKNLKRGLKHFQKEGAKLVNKDTGINDPYEKLSYELEGSKHAKKLRWKKLHFFAEKDKEDKDQSLL